MTLDSELSRGDTEAVQSMVKANVRGLENRICPHGSRVHRRWAVRNFIKLQRKLEEEGTSPGHLQALLGTRSMNLSGKAREYAFKIAKEMNGRLTESPLVMTKLTLRRNLVFHAYFASDDNILD